MEFPFSDPSPLIPSTKRGLPEELAQSPTAKRAKRAKRAKSGKKRCDESVNESAICAVQDDWACSDTGPATQKDLEDTEMCDAPAQNIPKTEANTGKSRAEPDHQGKPKYPIINGREWIPAVAGPSRPRAGHRELAEQPRRELTPLSEIAPPLDYTFKAFPNPTTSDYNPPEVLEKPKTKDEETKAAGESPQVTTNKNDFDEGTSPIIPARGNHAGTKTLKAINKHLKAIETKLNEHSPDEIESLRAHITRLQERLDLDGLRAAIRHEILFNALIKVATDVGKLSSQIEAAAQNQRDESKDEQISEASITNITPPARVNQKKGRDGIAAAAAAIKESKDKQKVSLRKSRKTLEQCLRSYTEDMDRAGSMKAVRNYGGLCVQYAEDLFKTLG
ncbi:uncharacterized protein B0T15DRAFT_559843 [Chaetomium strumarium]|uniref:Uncharacterized protein n=1 Tax=Chaetomium strumarium TaxID=1170767 RepID=A0AAJ0GN85_9PEZI|nr:hypothetical protein B0T15DRAFT_559843 [Chaetomium strumarium]